MARPSIYNEAVTDEICARLACGESLVAICRGSDMPGMRTVMTWLSEKPVFRQKYTQAREDAGDADADLVSDIRDRVLSGELDPQAARVAIDALKWTAGKRKPKKYGDRIELEHSGGLELLDPAIRHARIAELTAKLHGSE